MTQDSIYYFKGIGEFKNYIQRIDDKTLTVAEALGTYRETENLSKTLKQTTVQQLIDEPKLILELVKTLRKVKEPESRFKLPYKKAEREQELIKDLSDNYEIDKEKAKAKILSGHFTDLHAKEFPQEFNYCIEAAMAPRTDIGSENAGEIEIIGCINSSLSVDGGENYFSGSNAYSWYDKKGRANTSSSIKEILEECGFTTSYSVNTSKKRVPSVLYINLNTPCPNWLGSAGKTHIDLTPYARDIAETVSKLAYKMPSYYGQGYGTPSWDFSGSGVGRQKSAKEYLEDFLYARYIAVKKDPSLIYSDPLTQSGVWYRLRPIMIEGRYQSRETWGHLRKYITNEIDDVCKNLTDENFKPLNLEREDLGIHAKARGMMLYDGSIYPINMETFEALGAKGVFMLVIEKEGIADVLKEEARGSGVALVHTAGRFVKYVKYLIEGASVPCAILTDYDYDGIKIAEETIRPTPRIGIDKDIVTWLQENGYPQLRIEDVEEEYTPRIVPDDDYLKEKRIELDAIVSILDPQALWKYIKYKIEKLQKGEGFDYSNVISKPEPEELYPEQIEDLITKLKKYIEDITAEDWEKIEKDELVGVKELISIKEQEKDNVITLTDIVNQHEIMDKEIIPRIKKLSDELDELID